MINKMRFTGFKGTKKRRAIRTILTPTLSEGEGARIT